jgi:hypothetical protein
LFYITVDLKWILLWELLLAVHSLRSSWIMAEAEYWRFTVTVARDCQKKNTSETHSECRLLRRQRHGRRRPLSSEAQEYAKQQHGISIEGLEAFVTGLAGTLMADTTTSTVCHSLIKPATATGGLPCSSARLRS